MTWILGGLGIVIFLVVWYRVALWVSDREDRLYAAHKLIEHYDLKGEPLSQEAREHLYRLAEKGKRL